MINLAEFLEKGSLYDELELSTDNIDELIAFLDGTIKLNLYCEHCEEMRVFSLNNTVEIHRLSQKFVRIGSPVPMLVQGYSNSTPTGNQERVEIDFNNLLGELDNRCMDFTCTYDAAHHICFYLKIISEEKIMLVKVGQFPSVASLATADLKRYKGVLPNNYLKEYSRALGLFSHGIGIGSFVYLRRVFEKLVFDAFKSAETEGALTQDDFDFIDAKKHQRRMEDKIKLLKGYLPDVIIENAGIYGVLSKGIHELSEEECKTIFPIINIGIKSMLNFYLEKERDKQEKIEFSKQMSKIVGETKKE